MSKREKILVIILLLITVGYVYIHFLIAPLQAQISEIQNQNKKMQEAILMAQRPGQGEGRASARDAEQIKKEFLKLSRLVPASPCIPEVSAFLEQSSRDINITLMSIDYQHNIAVSQNDNTPASYSIAGIDLVILGDYESIKSYIEKIESGSPRLYNIGKSRIRTVSGDLNSIPISDYRSGTLMMEMTIDAYYDNIALPDIIHRMNDKFTGDELNVPQK